MKGSYILLIELPRERNISIGKVGLLTFPKGFYAYVGSAMGGLESRIAHHLKRKSHPHWHIDWLLEKASIRNIFVSETENRIECALARNLSRELKPIPGFGCSDCKCTSHLYFGDGKILKAKIILAFDQSRVPFRLLTASQYKRSLSFRARRSS